MKFDLKSSGSITKRLLGLSVAAILTSILASILGTVFSIFSAAFLAGIMCFEHDTKRIYSIVSSVLVLIGSFAIGGFYSLVGAEIVVTAIIICLCVTYKRSKAECAAIMTFALTLSFIVSLGLYAISEGGASSLEAVFDYYSELFAQYKENALVYFEKQVTQLGDAVDNSDVMIETLEVLIDGLLYNSISILVIISFAISGFTLKAFSTVISHNCDKCESIFLWRFSLSSVMAYAAAVTIVLSFFASGSTDVFSITVINLYNIFSILFAYIGFSAALEFLAAKLGIGKAWLILILAVVLAFSFVEQLLAIFGIYVTIITNKFHSSTEG